MCEITAFCPKFQDAIELLGRRWTGAIVRALLASRTRFSEISDAVPDLTDRLLSARLKELETEGIVVRTVEPSTPVRIAYELTDKGRALGGIVYALGEWADEYCSAPEPPADIAG